MRERYIIWMIDTPVVSEYTEVSTDDQPKPKGAVQMKSKVFSISLHNRTDSPTVAIYRTNGRVDGGGLKFYTLTVPRLIRLLQAMVNRSIQEKCYTWTGSAVSTWTIAGVVEQMYAAQAALAAA